MSAYLEDCHKFNERLDGVAGLPYQANAEGVEEEMASLIALPPSPEPSEQVALAAIESLQEQLLQHKELLGTQGEGLCAQLDDIKGSAHATVESFVSKAVGLLSDVLEEIYNSGKGASVHLTNHKQKGDELISRIKSLSEALSSKNADVVSETERTKCVLELLDLYTGLHIVCGCGCIGVVE